MNYSDMAITTVLNDETRVWPFCEGFTGLRLTRFLNFRGLPLKCPDYSLLSKRANTVNISIKTSTRGKITHLVIDSSGLKVFGEDEWNVRQYGVDKHRVWRKLHLALDSATHEIICADLSHSSTTDAPALPELIKQTHRKIREASADGAYDTHYCHDALLKNKIKPLLSHHGVGRNIDQTDIMSVIMRLQINISAAVTISGKRK